MGKISIAPTMYIDYNGTAYYDKERISVKESREQPKNGALK